MTGQKLESYLSGRWTRGDGVETQLVDPVTGAVLATASAKGLDSKRRSILPARADRPACAT